MLPYLLELEKFSLTTYVDCILNYLGRDVELLKILSEKTGLKIITNMGYYEARKYKYFPQSAFIESAEQIANRWIGKAENGIVGLCGHCLEMSLLCSILLVSCLCL